MLARLPADAPAPYAVTTIYYRGAENKVEAEYLKVLRFDDEIEVRLRVDKVGRTSVTYAWTIAKDGDAHIKGRHTVVQVGSEGQPEPLSDALRALLDA